ncbi:tetratricopeptide repeat protein [candidate division KSB1 bacterium]|nr:tetratricopeptide repeat protein [candidate division KSB1 bacterium]
MMNEVQREEVRYLESKLKQNPDSLLFARLADMYLEMGQLEQAIQLCEKGIRKHPYYVTGHYIMGKCYLQKKQFDHAEKELKRVLLFDPHYVAAHRDYGNLMEQIGWHNSSEASYRKIVELDPFCGAAKNKLSKLQNTEAGSEFGGDELDIDLEEFEEPNAIPEEPTDTASGSRTDPQQLMDNLSESFPESEQTDATVTAHQDDENFSYILDDIFRDEEDTESDIPTSGQEPAEADDDDSFIALKSGDTYESASDSFDEFAAPEKEDENELPYASDLTVSDSLNDDEFFKTAEDTDTNSDEDENEFFKSNIEVDSHSLETDGFELNTMNLDLPHQDDDSEEPYDIMNGIESDRESDDTYDDESDGYVHNNAYNNKTPFSEEEEGELSKKLDQIDDIFELDDEESEPANTFSIDDTEAATDAASNSSDEDMDFFVANTASEKPEESSFNPFDDDSDTSGDSFMDGFSETKSDGDSLFEEQPEPAPANPSFSQHESEPESALKPKEKIVTPTLGEIYAAQHQYAKAIGVYEILRKSDPDNSFYEEKINYLKKKLEESKNLE